MQSVPAIHSRMSDVFRKLNKTALTLRFQRLFLRNQVLLEVVVGAYFVEDEPHRGVDLGVFGVVGLADEVDTILFYQSLGYRFLLAVAIDGNGMSALFLDYAHTRNVGFSVAQIDHPFEWNRPVLFSHILVDSFIVTYLFYALVDFEKELRFCRVIHGYSGPVGNSINIVEERAGVDILETFGYRGAFYHLPQSRVNQASTPLNGSTIGPNLRKESRFSDMPLAFASCSIRYI